MRGGHEAVDEEFDGVWRGIGGEGIDFGGGRGEAGEVEGESAEEGGAIGFVGGLEALFFEFGEDEAVDGVFGGWGGGGGWERGACGLGKGPVGFVGGAGGDPFVEDVFLGGGEGAV